MMIRLILVICLRSWLVTTVDYRLVEMSVLSCSSRNINIVPIHVFS